MENALKAVHLVMSGFETAVPSPLSDGLVSAFIHFREQTEVERECRECEQNELTRQSQMVIQELEVNRDLVEQEVVMLRNKLDGQAHELHARDAAIHNADRTAESLRNRIRQMELSHERLTATIAKIEHDLQAKSKRESAMRSQRTRLEQELQKVRCENAKQSTELEQLHRNQKTSNDESQAEVVRLRQKCALLCDRLHQKDRLSLKVDSQTPTVNASPPAPKPPENVAPKGSRRPTPTRQSSVHASRQGSRLAIRESIR
jgi:hypothetical protein